jgi:CRP/FNR family transcriptional regulator, cyclic AMP receptor protein
MDKFEQILAEHPLFKDFKESHLHVLVGCSSNVVFKPGEFIGREGDPADEFYLVRHGKVTVETFAPGRGPVTIDTVVEGEVMGWSWMIPPYTSHFDARALELTRAIRVDAACLRKKLEEDHDLGYEVMKRFVQLILRRLHNTRLQLLDWYGNEK